MKKIISIAIAVVMIATFSACGSTQGGTTQTIKTGLGMVSNVKITAAGEKDGSTQVDTTSCALSIDENGVIVSVSFDVTQGKAKFGADGSAKTEPEKNIKSKKEYGADYNMKAASPIQKEYDEQIAALEEYCKGKKVEDVLKMELTEKKAPVDLATSCTISIGDYLVALEKAAKNAK